jgi:hypothetical protein
MWAVDYSVLYGNPADQREWDEKLDPYLETVFTRASGQTMKASSGSGECPIRRALTASFKGRLPSSGWRPCRSSPR